jgi:hypothetical protein
MRVVEGEVEHVVEEVAGEEARGDAPGKGQLKNDCEEEPEKRPERHRYGRWHDETHRVVWMIVMDTVHDEMQPRAQPLFRLEVEDNAVDPVFAERPDRVPGEDPEDRLEKAHVVERTNPEDDDRRSEDERHDCGMDARQAIERSCLEQRGRGAKSLGPGRGLPGSGIVGHQTRD